MDKCKAIAIATTIAIVLVLVVVKVISKPKNIDINSVIGR